MLQRDLAQRSGRLEGLQARTVPLQEQVVKRSRVNLLLLFAVAAAVLTIACVNCAQLLHVRQQDRRREWAIRRALGASEGRIAWQVILEAVIVAVVAGVAALGCMVVAVRLTRTATGVDIPRLDHAGVNGRVLLFALGMSLLAGLVSALSPAIRSLRTDTNSDLKASAGGHTHTGGSQGSLLLTAEVALSTDGADRRRHAGAQFSEPPCGRSWVYRKNASAIQLNLTDVQYSDAAQRSSFVDSLVSRVRALPMVSAVGVASRVPLGGGAGGAIFSAEGTTLPRLERPVVAPIVADPAYFAAVGIPLLSGRTFQERDRGGRSVAIISAAVANQAWPGQEAVGRRFGMGSDQAPLVEVIGVLGSARNASLSKPPSPDVYFPYWQDDMSLYSDRLSLVFRSPSSGIVAVRNVLSKLDPRMPWPEVRSLEDMVNVSLAPRRFQRNVMVLMALIAAFLTFIGIYGVISHRVASRTREVGIRVALGARIGSVQGLVFRQSLKGVVAGTALGAVAAVPLMLLLSSVLFGIDQQGMAVTFLLCMLIGPSTAVAAHWPIRRLVHLDPVVALRAE